MNPSPSRPAAHAATRFGKGRLNCHTAIYCQAVFVKKIFNFYIFFIFNKIKFKNFPAKGADKDKKSMKIENITR